MLSSWPEFMVCCHFQCSTIVFKYLTPDRWCYRFDRKVVSFHFLDQLHDGYHLSQWQHDNWKISSSSEVLSLEHASLKSSSLRSSTLETFTSIGITKLLNQITCSMQGSHCSIKLDIYLSPPRWNMADYIKANYFLTF